MKIEEKIENLIIKPIEENNYELYDVEYVKEGKDYYLKIFIEKENAPIDIQDCEKINDIVNPILDKEDIIKDQYFLEVSSTGIEKNLRKSEHYKKAIGKEIKVKLFQKDEEGNKELQGILIKANEEEITIEQNGKNINIQLTNIANGKTVYHWEGE